MKKISLNCQPSYVEFRAQAKWDQKIICPSPWTTVHIFSKLRSHVLEVEGHDLGTLYLIDIWHKMLHKHSWLPGNISKL